MPAGVLVSRPLPLDAPFASTDSMFGTNVAVTVRGASIVASHAACEQSPLNATKTDVPAGSGCRMTRVPSAKRAVQVPEGLPAESVQSMPPGRDTMRPLPVPLPLTERVTGAGTSVTRVGVDFGPEQAESTETAATAVRNCRTTAASRTGGMGVQVCIC